MKKNRKLTKKGEKNMLKRNKGITLIALVITIIILLILASVSIAMLTGNNGILTQAQKAKNETEDARIEEENILDNYENYINDVTGDVSQVNDTNPGVLEGSGTEQAPFIINSIEDLVVFADNVTKGINNYEGQYVELGISLDFNSDKSYVNPNREDYANYGYNGKLKKVLNTSGFIPIGKSEYIIGDEMNEVSFNGNFDGKKYKIYNLKIIQEKNVDENTYIASGMFSGNLGSIENVYIENGMNSTTMNGGKYLNTGLLVGENSGKISNCYVNGEINTEKTDWACNIGGLVGSNKGTIKQCYNSASMNAKYSCMENRIGGIAGVNEETGIIENVYNTGNISAEVFGEQKPDYPDRGMLGGIAGRNIGKINTAYAMGLINNFISNSNVETLIDGVSVHYNESGEINNCYYLKDIINSSGINTTISENGEVRTSEQMKSQEFLDLLNQNNSGMWKFSNGNNQYPVLYWQ